MITIKGKIVDGVKDGPERELTPEEKATVTSSASVGENYVYYQGDEPEPVEIPFVEPPNWLGLEQDLRYSNDGALFYKAYVLAPDKGFAFFVATLQNGVAGRSSENALATAFQLLPIKYVNSEPVVTFEWTKEEKDIINSLLEKNNFVYRLT